MITKASPGEPHCFLLGKDEPRRALRRQRQQAGGADVRVDHPAARGSGGGGGADHRDPRRELDDRGRAVLAPLGVQPDREG